ncbi:Probable RNA-binding protein EIF1AD [Linum grandiflorum]
MKERSKMKGGRKNLKRAAGDEHTLKLEDGQCMMQVLSLRGSNLIEVMGTNGEKSLALFPAKFQKSMWIKNGSFVIVDESGKEKAIESGSKVTCIVSQVLFYEQVRKLQKSPEWPEIFKSTTLEDTNRSSLPKAVSQEADEHNSSEDEYDDLPPLVANKNRIQPPSSEVDSESDTGSDSDS